MPSSPGKTSRSTPSAPLLGNISTDEITPGWVCYYYDETLAPVLPRRPPRRRRAARRHQERRLRGHRQRHRPRAAARAAETAPYSELAAGVQLVVARSIEKIYRQNAQNIGLLTSTDFGLVPRIAARRGDPDRASSRKGLDPISAAIVEHGGLFAYNKARLAGQGHAAGDHDARAPDDALREDPRAPRHRRRAGAGRLGVPAVKPGDAFFARADVRFSHEYVTPMAEALFRSALRRRTRR